MPNPSTIAQEESWGEYLGDLLVHLRQTEFDRTSETETPTYREYRVILGLSKPYGGIAPESKGTTVEISEHELLNFLRAYFAPIREAFSVSIGYGFWRGKREGSATVSWIAADHVVSAADAHELARSWNKRHNQECSIVSWTPVEHFDFVS